VHKFDGGEVTVWAVGDELQIALEAYTIIEYRDRIVYVEKEDKRRVLPWFLLGAGVMLVIVYLIKKI
jgi:hypothetical protein